MEVITKAETEAAHLVEQSEAMRKLYANSQVVRATKELAAQLKYNGSLSVETLEDGIRESQGRIGAELFAIGARLLLLKEQCEHGQFLETLERLDINSRAAQKFMQVSLKFSKAPISAHLQKVGKSKILELLVLDDEEIEELGIAGSVRGLQLDDIDRMPVSELRKKLREEKNKTEAQDKLIKSKNDTIDQLLTEADAKPAELATPDEELAKLHSQCARLVSQIDKTIQTELRSLVVRIGDHHHINGGDSAQILNGYMSQITAELGEVRALFGGLEDAEPDWQKWNDDQHQLDLEQGE